MHNEVKIVLSYFKKKKKLSKVFKLVLLHSTVAENRAAGRDGSHVDKSEEKMLLLPLSPVTNYSPISVSSSYSR